jgi:UrcA family protein
MSRFTVLLLAGLAGATAAAAPAIAGDVRSIHVSAQDLDLSAPAGRAALEDRIRGAVREVCTVSDWGPGLDAQRHAETCAAQALAATRPQVEALLRTRQLANASITVTPR